MRNNKCETVYILLSKNLRAFMLTALVREKKGDTVTSTSIKKYASPPTQQVPPVYMKLHVK